MLNALLKTLTARRLGLTAVLFGTVVSTEAATVALSLSELRSTTLEAHPLASKKELRREARRFLEDARRGELFVWFIQGNSEDENYMLVEEVGEDGEMIRELLSLDSMPSDEAMRSLRKDVIIYDHPDTTLIRQLQDVIGMPESLSLGLGTLKFERGDLQLKAAIRMPPKEERSRSESIFNESGLRTELIWTEFSVNWKF